MSLGLLGLGLVAGLCGAVRAASTRFDVIYTWPRFKAYSSRKTLLQGIAVVARGSELLNGQFTMYQCMVSNSQAAWKHGILSKPETGPKTSNYQKINGPRDREAYRWSDWKPNTLTKSMSNREQCNPLISVCVRLLHTPDQSRAGIFVAHRSPPVCRKNIPIV